MSIKFRPEQIEVVTGSTNNNVVTTQGYVDDHTANGMWQRVGTEISVTNAGDTLNFSSAGVIKNMSLDSTNISSYDLHPTFTLDTQLVDKKYVDDQLGAENIWDRTGTTVTLHNAGDIVQFDQTAGIQFGVGGNTINTIDTDINLTADSDLRLATQKATKFYVDNHTGNAIWTLTGNEVTLTTTSNTIGATVPLEYTSHPSFTTDEQLVDKKYVDDQIGGENIWDRVTGTPNYVLPHTPADEIGNSSARITKINLEKIDGVVTEAVEGNIAYSFQTTLGDDVDAISSVYSKITSYSGGLTSGHEAYGFLSDVVGNANDNTGKFYGFSANFTPNGGTSHATAFICANNFDECLLSLSGDIEFRDYDVTIFANRFASGDGNNIEIKAGYGLAASSEARNGGSLNLKCGEGVNGGTDGEIVFGDDASTFGKFNSDGKFQLATGTSVNEIVTTLSGATDDQIPTAAAVQTQVNGIDFWNRVTGTPNYLEPNTAGDEIGALGSRITKGWFTSLDSTSGTIGTLDLASGTTVNEIVTSVSASSTDDQLATAKAVYDAVLASDQVSPPSGPGATGVAGQWAYGSGYMYRCVATDTWVRWAVVTTW